MRVRHLDCGPLRTIVPLDPGSPPLPVVCHCLLLETERDGLVLVDTGLGTDDLADPDGRLGADWVAFAQPRLNPGATALQQIRRLGHVPADVRHIVLTHLHRDHTGGLPDFPDATVHVLAPEHHAVSDPAAPHHTDSLDRFMPAHRRHPIHWSIVPPTGTNWYGIDCAAPLPHLADELVMVPLPGHTPGHSGVAVRGPNGWLFHTGDTYFHHTELTTDSATTHPQLEPIQEGAQVDRDARLRSLELLRRLRREHGAQIDIFSAHDPWEFHRLVGPDIDTDTSRHP